MKPSDFVRGPYIPLLETVPGLGDAALLAIKVADLPHFEPIFKVWTNYFSTF